MTLHTAQRDGWFRQDRVTELLAWTGTREIAANRGLIYIPLHYRLASAGSSESMIRSVATVLAAVCAHTGDTLCAVDTAAESGTTQKPLMLSISARFDQGWVVSQLDPVVAGIVHPDTSPASRLAPPPILQHPWAGLPGRSVCATVESCEVILPDIPPLHVHTLFGLDDADSAAALSAADRTLAVLRAAANTPYGTRLKQVERLVDPRWWLLPLALLVVSVFCAFTALLGPVTGAIRKSRNRCSRTNLSRCFAWLTAWWWLPLLWRRRGAKRAARRSSTGDEVRGKLSTLVENVAEGIGAYRVPNGIGLAPGTDVTDWLSASDRDQTQVRRWLKDVRQWERLSDKRLEHMQRCFASLKTFVAGWQNEAVVRGLVCCTGECSQGRTGEKGSDDFATAPRKGYDAPEIDLRKAKMRLKRTRRRAKRLAKRARPLAKRATKIAVTIRRRDTQLKRVGAGMSDPEGTAEDWGDLVKQMRRIGALSKVAAAGVQRDARTVKSQAAQLSSEAKGQFYKIEQKRRTTVVQGLKYMVENLRQLRGTMQENLAGAFKSFGTLVLVRFWTLTWLPGPISLRLVSVAVSVGWLVLGPGEWSWVRWVPPLALLVGLGLLRRSGRSESLDVLLGGAPFATALLHAFVLRVDEPALTDAALAGVHEDVWLLVHAGVGAMVFLAVALRREEFAVCRFARDSLNRLSRLRPTRWTSGSRRDMLKRNGLIWYTGLSVLAYVALLALTSVVAYGWESRVFLGVSSSLDALRVEDASRNREVGWILPCLLGMFMLPLLRVGAHLRISEDKESGP